MERRKTYSFFCVALLHALNNLHKTNPFLYSKPQSKKEHSYHTLYAKFPILRRKYPEFRNPKCFHQIFIQQKTCLNLYSTKGCLLLNTALNRFRQTDGFCWSQFWNLSTCQLLTTEDLTTETKYTKKSCIKIVTGHSTIGLGPHQLWVASRCRSREQKAWPRGKGSKLSLHSYKL